MAIKIHWDGGQPVATCDTAAEAFELLKQGKSSNENGTGKAHSNANANDESTEARMKRMLSILNGNAKKMLVALVNYPNGVEGGAFSKAVDINASAFGGILGSVSKAAKKSNIKYASLVISETRFEGTRRYRWLAPAKLLLEHKGIL